MDDRVIIDAFDMTVGESPVWHPDEQKLYWADIATGRIFRIDPFSREAEMIYEGEGLNGMALHHDGSLLLLGAGGGVSTWRGGERRPLVERIPEDRGYNDMGVDPLGRIYAGMQGVPDPEHPDDPEKTIVHLHCIDLDGSRRVMDKDLKGTNGVGISGDHKTLYFTDTQRRTIFAYDYDEESGDLSNRRPFVVQDPEGPVPDGLAIDADGCVWSAQCGRPGGVNCYSPAGELVNKIEVTTAPLTSVAFGGPNYELLFGTSLGGVWKESCGEDAGAVFMFEPGVKGRPEFVTRVNPPG